MKIVIDVPPKEFENHFLQDLQDRFEDSLHRLSADAHCLTRYDEQETVIMLIKALKNAKIEDKQ